MCTHGVITVGIPMAEQEKTPSRAPQRVGVREFRGNFSGFMRQVRHGASFVVTSRDEAIAVIQPPRSQLARRRPGTLRGRIEMAPDFDAMLPELLAAMEHEEG